MKKKVSCLLWILCLLLNLAACAETEIEKTNTVPSAAPTETVPETTLPVETTQSAESSVLWDPPSDKVCVGILPTETGRWQYIVIEDQEAAVAAMEAAVDAVSSDEWWIKGDQTMGIMIWYQGEFWYFVLSGELVSPLGRVGAEDAQPLYDLCFAAAVEAGWQEGVYPVEIADLTSATLLIDDHVFTQTDPATLDTLETMLSAGKLSLGGTGCPFGALLTMEREVGEPITIRLATDSCGVWMSQGNYYQFASDNQPLYDLFSVTLEFGKVKQ